MPPLLALLLCSSFVLVLLRWEAAQSRGKVSRALWIPTIWLLSISSKPLAIWFGSVGDPEAGSPLDRNLQTALLLAGMAILASRRINWRSAFVENRWFVVLIAFKFVSILWSDIPFVSFKRGVR